MTKWLSETWSIYIVFKPQSIGIEYKKRPFVNFSFWASFFAKGLFPTQRAKPIVEGQSRYTGAVKMPRENLHNQVALTCADTIIYACISIEGNKRNTKQMLSMEFNHK